MRAVTFAAGVVTGTLAAFLLGREAAEADELIVKRILQHVHTRELAVESRGGHVTLSGRIPAGEVDALYARISRLRGVKSIRSEVEIVERRYAARS